MRFLLISPYLPHSAIGHGGGIATYHFARELARRHELRVLCFQRSDETAARAELEMAGATVKAVPFRSDRDRGLLRLALVADRLRALRTARRRKEPLHVAKYWQPRMFESLREELADFRPDVVQFEYTMMARYAEATRRARGAGRVPIVILNTHEAGVLPRRRRLEAAPDPTSRRRAARELERWERHERYAVGSADLIQCVTEQDRALYLELGADPERLWTQPLGVELDSLPAAAPPQLPPRLLFVGSFDHLPNRDAARWLIESYWPRARQLDPELSLDVVGTRPPQWLSAAAKADSRLRVHGFVERLDHIFDGVTLFLAPLFSGGGIKIKILEALARATCVVSTPIGVEGVELQPEEHFWPARDLDEFVAQTKRALTQPQEARAVAERARVRIADRYRWSRLVDDLERRILEFREGTS